MKLNINNKTTLLAAIFTSGLIHAQTIVPAPGVQVLGNALVEGDAIINDSLHVTLPGLEPSQPVITTLPDGIPNPVTLNVDNGPGIRSEEVRRVTVQDMNVLRQGGATIDALGNTTLAQRETRIDQASYSIVRTFDVDENGVEVEGTERFFFARPDQQNPGQVIALTVPIEVPVLDENGEPAIDADGNAITQTIQEPVTVNSLAEAEAFANNTFIGDEVLAAVTIPGTPVSAGGNLTVQGLATTNGIDNSGAKITNIANGTAATDAASVGQVAAGDAALGGRIDTESAARISQDSAIRSEFAAADTVIRRDFTAADTALGGRIDTESAARISGDNLLGGRIDAETAARISQDSAIRSEFAAADIAIRRDFTAADTAIRQDFAAADANLQSQMDENTRGIAMVAAMTNTRVEAGKTHGVDFNIAQFQSETGFAFGYANRINDNVQLHGAVASTTDLDESVARVGVAFQW